LFIERNPREVAEDFYVSTFIAVSAYSHDGKIQYSGGDHYRHGDYDIINKLLEKMSIPSDTSYTSLTLTNHIGYNYTAYFINKSRLKDGFIITGPYNQDDLERINSLDICYLNNLYMAPLNQNLDLCPKKGCAACYSLNVRRAMNYIQAHYKENITLDSVISHLDLNKSYFCTLFKRESGVTFTHYVNLIRIEKSKRQLLKDNRSVLDIALSVGFSNQNYYTIIFKRMTTMTPMEFRKKVYI
jgi:AraC-like DNA-binding protein